MDILTTSRACPSHIHEDVSTTLQLYAQSDQKSRLEALGKSLELLLGDKAHFVDRDGVVIILGHTLGWRQSVSSDKGCGMMVARDGIEPPTPAFSGLRSTD